MSETQINNTMEVFRKEKNESHSSPTIERSQGGKEIKYQYSDGETILVVMKPGDHYESLVTVTRTMPNGDKNTQSFDRTNRGIDTFFDADTLEELQLFIKDKKLGQVLDVGTGQGKFVDDLRDAGIDARGLDIWLNSKQIESGNFILASAHRTGLPDNSIDTIFINTFMYYGIDDKFYQQILQELSRILRPNGRILISEVDPDRAEYLKSILTNSQLEINPSSEFSKDAPNSRSSYTELLKISE